MAKLRSKERDKREGFRKHVLPFVPGSVLAGLGLLQQPPHCQISLPAQPCISPPISPADLQRIPMGGGSSLVITSPLLVRMLNLFLAASRQSGIDFRLSAPPSQAHKNWLDALSACGISAKYLCPIS